MRERLIVHVGMHKTGTSSIQDSLAANLEDPRFQYVQFGQPNGSLAILQAYGRLSGIRPNAPPDDDIERRLIGRRKGMTLITEALNGLHGQTGIVSGEAILTLSTKDLAFFFDLLRRYRRNTKVVAYLRRPKAYTESAYQQKLKSLFVPLAGQPQVIAYRSVFERFDEVVGRSQVSLWLFDPPTLTRGCVVQDFCRRMKIKFPPSKVIRSNDGLSASATQLLYIFRKKNPTFARRDKTIVEALSELKGNKLRFHSQLLSEIMRAPADQLDWASERVGEDMNEDYAVDDAMAIRNEADMLNLSPETIDWLGAATGVSAKLMSRDLDSIATAVASLGKTEPVRRLALPRK